jgi:hypothetical protein
LIGYDDQPSAMQFIFFVVAFVVIGTLMKLVDRPHSSPHASRPITAAIHQN